MQESGSAKRLRTPYRVEDVADLLNVHRNTVYRLIATGELAALRIRDTYRISQKALDTYLEAATVQPTGAAS